MTRDRHYGEGRVGNRPFLVIDTGGFEPVAAYNAVKATTLAVLGLMLEDTARMRSGARRSDVSKLPAERFPGMHEAARVADSADTYSYLIDVLVDGLAANV